MGKDWEGLQEEIRSLYHVDNKPLDEVMSLMRSQHNFVASQRSYRSQIKKWGYTKYNKRVHPSLIKRFGFECGRQTDSGGFEQAGPACNSEEVDSGRSSSSKEVDSGHSSSSKEVVSECSMEVDSDYSKGVDSEYDKQVDMELNQQFGMELNSHGAAKPNPTSEPTTNLRLNLRPHITSPNLNPLRRKGRIKRPSFQRRFLHPITFLPVNKHLSAYDPANPYLSTNTPGIPSLLDEHHHAEPPPPQTAPLRLPRITLPSDRENLNQQDIYGRTQLHRAVLFMDTAQVRTLLVSGAAVGIKDCMGNEAIHYSIFAGGEGILESLLLFGAKIDAKGELGRSPLHRAASGVFGLFDAVIKAGADLSIQDENGDTPLHLAISAALDDTRLISTADLIAVINSGCDVNLPNDSGVTPFVELLDRPYSQPTVLDAIHSCLLRGGRVNDIQPDGRTLFQIFLARSVTQGSRWIKRICGYSQEGILEKQILETFLEKGGSISTPMPSGSSLYAYYFAIALEPLWRQDAKMMDVFCKLSPPGPLEGSGDCILHRLAANYGPLSQAGSAVDELMQLQLNKGADPNFRNREGKTPLLCLFESSRNTDRRSISPLLSYGADPWQKDGSGTCALFEAAKGNPRRKDEILRALLEADLRHMDTGEIQEPKYRFRWDDWNSAATAADWSESKRHILDQLTPLPAGVDEAVRCAAFSVLAGKHIRLSKARFSGDTTDAESRRCYVTGILRDCRARDAFVHMAWVDHLLEL